MPIRSPVVAVSIALVAALTGAAIAGDVDAFLAGTSRNCIECDLSARDLTARDFKRAKLDGAKLANADLCSERLFRASMVRAVLHGACIKHADIYLAMSMWSDLRTC